MERISSKPLVQETESLEYIEYKGKLFNKVLGLLQAGKLQESEKLISDLKDKEAVAARVWIGIDYALHCGDKRLSDLALHNTICSIKNYLDYLRQSYDNLRRKYDKNNQR